MNSPERWADRNTQAVHRLSVGRAGRAHLSLLFLPVAESSELMPAAIRHCSPRSMPCVPSPCAFLPTTSTWDTPLLI